ncbi:hypothetical protein WDL1P1_00226 (plasmid) [Variovorax sp. WDL1]|nr:hypothetical protein APY03_2452 [Variovorax sp. WDL1]PNG50187.1 hypothetical protein CHC06_05810 [Variovorax sp. B2]PNG51060.1 hypothetical protein CHC07_05716 [Variovorax sp. B4]VTU42262.1 hypothetical protein SRS16P1_00226 [Variovorax sp. SRS16]VTU42289.1 hypothetical protein E5P1_00224 [Variovorax sp. PBL-E5]VTU44241.1 hypothetical protein H6P1_00707 [Variovorax sp. PBL-H6]
MELQYLLCAVVVTGLFVFLFPNTFGNGNEEFDKSIGY